MRVAGCLDARPAGLALRPRLAAPQPLRLGAPRHLRRALLAAPRAGQPGASDGAPASAPAPVPEDGPGSEWEEAAAEGGTVGEEAAEAVAAATLEAASGSGADGERLEGAARAVPPAAQGPLGVAQEAWVQYPALRYVGLAGAAYLGLTFLWATGKVALRALSPKAKRGRTVNKNKLVVDELARYLPADRSGLSGSVLAGIRLRTGFSGVELYRKFLWYLLRERKFDGEAVEDLVALKTALRLTDDQVAEALRERAQRIYDKYGAVMLNTEGMTAAGIERKATARALFSKLQYLVQCDRLLSPEAAQACDLRAIFGATEDDVARLRIVSLHEVDLERLASMAASPEAEAGASSGGEAGAASSGDFEE